MHLRLNIYRAFFKKLLLLLRVIGYIKRQTAMKKKDEFQLVRSGGRVEKKLLLLVGG